MELRGAWEAVEADDDRRRTWLGPLGLTATEAEEASDSEPAASAEAGTSADPEAESKPEGGTASEANAESATGPEANSEAETASETETSSGADPEAGAEDWVPIAVPGHWRNETAFAESDGPLLYRHRFEHPTPAPGDRWWLCFDGVFYQGDVWLDGGYVGDTEGYFFPHTFEVTEQLAARTDHVLGIEVTCSRPSDPTTQRNITGAFQHSESIDPAWNPGGIWRPVRLERTGPVRIRHLRVVCRDADETRATVRFRAVLDAAESVQVTLRSSVGHVETTDTRHLATGENQVEWQIRVDEPELWWPHTLGDQPLHDVVVEVAVHPPRRTDEDDDTGPADDPHAPTEDEGDDTGPADDPHAPAEDGNGPDDHPYASAEDGNGPDDHPHAPGGPGQDDDGSSPADRAVEADAGDDEEAPTVSHRLTRRIGLRQVNLRGWVLHINGEQMFVKGAALGPSRVDLARATPEDLRADIELARSTGLDLVRVHSHISRPELYEAADEAGLLIWQDFPLHGIYARSIRKQAQRQAREAVDLLGHHPSIVVWCGHDAPVPGERVEVADDGERTRRRGGLRHVAAHELPTWNKSILDRTIRRALDRADGSRPVIAHSGVLPHPPLLDGTDTHLGLGRHHGDSRDIVGLARVMPRLVRWVGSFGAPSVPASAEFCRPDRWPDLDWDELADHHGMDAGAFDRWAPPTDHRTFDAWREATQAHQSRVLQHVVETLRRLKYRPAGGFVLSQLIDAQPAISTAVVDHRRVPKAAHAGLVQLCRPVIVVADLLPGEVRGGDTVALDLHIVSDLRTPLADLEVHAELTWPGGAQRWRFAGEVEADTCMRVGTLQIEVPDRPGPLELTVSLSGPHLPGGVYRRQDTAKIV